MSRQSQRKIGCNISKLFIKMNLLTRPAQQNIYNELQTNERHGQHSRPLDFSIIKNKIRKLRNNKSPFSDKLEVKW